LTGLLATGLLLGLSGSATAAVVINELLYHPLDGDPDAEFLELYNTGGSPVSLDGWCI
ncbi:MAG: hypothetical protein GWN07_18205, partial [Actinobacteria bacterium]|nr:hypothetical protein [Actinomycetota bacterium]